MGFGTATPNVLHEIQDAMACLERAAEAFEPAGTVNYRLTAQQRACMGKIMSERTRLAALCREIQVSDPSYRSA